MKIRLLFLVVASGLSCNAANIIWEALSVDKMELGEGENKPFCVFNYDWGVPYFYVSVFHDVVASTFTLSFRTPEDPVLVGLGYENPYLTNMHMYENVVFAKEGDIVSSTTTRFLDDSKYAVHYGIDDNRYFFGELMDVTPSTDIYLSYICSYYPLEGNPYYYYGWVSMYLDNEGTIHAYGAFDSDGGPMVVGGGAWTGGIPEPSGGMLFLLGLAMLGLRRIRM
jgi:hypothetical protein